MNVVFVEATQDSPYRFSAGNVKAEFMGRGFIEAGARVSFINGPLGKTYPTEEQEGSTDWGAHYFFPPRNGGFLRKTFGGMRWIYRKIKKLFRPGDENILIVEGGYFPFFIFYCITGRLLGYRVVAIFHEWQPSFTGVGIIKRLNNLLQGYCFGYFVHAVLPISHFLKEKAERFHKPQMLLPILGDFDRKPDESTKTGPCFSYCAQAGYFRIIQFLLDVWKHLPANVQLRMVLSGQPEELERVQREIAKRSLSAQISVQTKLPYAELRALYASSAGLLIPLDPESLQDKARFSQKIAEYLATGRPVVTTAVGEIPYYFKHNVNAYVTKFSPGDYADCLNFLLNHPQEACAVGAAGRELGAREFNYHTFGKALTAFFRDTVCRKKTEMTRQNS